MTKIYTTFKESLSIDYFILPFLRIILEENV